MRFPPKEPQVAIPVCSLSYFYIGMPVVGTDGWAGGCTVTSLPKFLGCTGYKIFLPMVLRCVEESSVNIKAVNYALFLSNHIADLLICC